MFVQTVFPNFAVWERQTNLCMCTCVGAQRVQWTVTSSAPAHRCCLYSLNSRPSLRLLGMWCPWSSGSTSVWPGCCAPPCDRGAGAWERFQPCGTLSLHPWSVKFRQFFLMPTVVLWLFSGGGGETFTFSTDVDEGCGYLLWACEWGGKQLIFQCIPRLHRWLGCSAVFCRGMKHPEKSL